MTEQDEAFLVDYLRDLLDADGQLTADEMLTELRQQLQNCELAEADKDFHTQTIFAAVASEKRQAWLARNLRDRDSLRRILSDPRLPEVLVSVEDASLFGG